MKNRLLGLVMGVSALAFTAGAGATPDAKAAFTGPYVGVNLGYAGGKLDTKGDFSPSGEKNVSEKLSETSFLGGFQAGYGHVWDCLFLGAEARLNFSSFDFKHEPNRVDDTDKLTVKKSAPTFGVRVMPGVLIQNMALCYLILGVDWTRWTATSFTEGGTLGPAEASSKKTRAGFDIGLGTAVPVTDNVTVGMEVTHTRFKEVKVNHDRFANWKLCPHTTQAVVRANYAF